MIPSNQITLEINGEVHTLTEWAEQSGIPVQSIRARFNKKERDPENWTPEQVVYGRAGQKIKQMQETGNLPEGVSARQAVPNMVNTIQEFIIDSISAIGVQEIYEEVSPKIKQKLIDDFGFKPEVHKVIIPNRDDSQFEGVTHEKFDEILALVANHIPVFLVGEGGTGKNVICEQISKALGVDFYFSNAVTQEYKISGFIDANGLYHDTQFFNAFTKGGLFFLDELDGSIPEVLIMLNAALANGYFDFPKQGRVAAHPNFYVVAAGNTIGRGADVNYTGRYSLDVASLDRFAVIKVEYSPKIEMAVSKNNEELCKFAHAFRAAAAKASISCLFSYRSISRITTLQEVIKDLVRVLDISLLKGVLGKDDINIIVQNIYKDKLLNDNNKYLQALRKLT